MSIHDDPTQTSPAQPPRKRRPWYRRWYGDPGTHHLSVISEGNWTVQVVTAS